MLYFQFCICTLSIFCLIQRMALFWYNFVPSMPDDPDLATMHAGCPVLQGNKWSESAFKTFFYNFTKFWRGILITKVRLSLPDWLTPLFHAAQSKAFSAKKKGLAFNSLQSSPRGRVDMAMHFKSDGGSACRFYSWYRWFFYDDSGATHSGPGEYEAQALTCRMSTANVGASLL